MSVSSVDARTLKQWLDKKEAILIDVREPEEHAEQSIPGATLLPMASLSKMLLPEHGNKKLVFHCRKGGRGGKACEKLIHEIPGVQIYNLEGGITAWAEAGLPVNSGEVKGEPKSFCEIR